MIGKLPASTSAFAGQDLAKKLDGRYVEFLGQKIIVTSSLRAFSPEHAGKFEEIIDVKSDAQLTSLDFMPKRTVDIGGFEVGGKSIPLILGPCSIESEDQIRQVGQFLRDENLSFIRGSAFKPRTTPYGFQGLGFKGMQLIREVADNLGLKVVSETRDTRDIDVVVEYADVVQIGAKAMYDYALLEKAAKSNKPVLLKRGFGSTIQEFLQVAEFILLAGNENLILCERGIRTFESKSRFTLDLAGAIFVLHHANLPLFVDPSHAMGQRWGVSQLGLGALAAGADGLLVEMHPNPDQAKTDSSQQIDFSTASDLVRRARLISEIEGRQIV